MDQFEKRLKKIIEYTQYHLHPQAFVMYQLNFITIATLDQQGSIRVLADAPLQNNTFDILYSQLKLHVVSGSKV